MKRKTFVRVAAPGLPPYPPLWLDPVRRYAVVSARHATWRSHEWAHRAVRILHILVIIGFAAWLWNTLEHGELADRLFTWFLLVSISFPIALVLMKLTLVDFLAARVFATKTTLWFTPQTILLRSHLYAKPVLLWRSWNDQPVLVRFILQPDPEADAYAHGLDPKQRRPTEHLREAKMLEVVLATAYRQRTASAPGEGAMLRSIPLTEINSRVASKFTMVYTAAVMLTAVVPPKETEKHTTGQDIDLH